jgi:polysaccharide biosynthesis/export protein
MSCVLISGVGWGKRLTGRRGQAQTPLAYALGAALALPLAATGCASGAKGADRSQGWYDSGSVSQFDAETRQAGQPLMDSEYVLGVGDLLEIVFLYHSNLTTRDVVIRRDGRISLPYVGDHMAAGITPMVLDSLLESRFSEILRDPSLAVIVKKPAPQKAYVLGEVRTPGQVQFEDELTMLQSIASAGGFQKGALPAHVILIRRQGVTKIVGVEVDLKAAMDGAVMQNDLRLRNYDIVFVPQHPIFTAADFMEQVGKIIAVPLDVVFKGWQVANLASSYEYFRSNNPTQINAR